jgi:hypothetical protein
MASAVATNKLRSNMAARTYIHNPADATVAVVVAWADLSLYANFMALAAFVSGTGVLTCRIMASENADGSGSPIEVKAHAAPTAADAEDDQLCLECSAEELAALGISTGVDLRYVGVEMDCDHADDIVAVTYIRANPTFARAALTATSIIDGVETP